MSKKSAPTILSIASGKGGVGKTWLSITLAHHLARTNRKVLLFDGDIGLANVDVQLGLTPNKDLTTVFGGKATLDESITPYKEGGFDVIAGRSGSGGLGLLPASRLQAFTEELKHAAQDYDYTLLDLAAGVEPHVRILAGIAQQCLVIVTDEPTSLTDSYAFIKLCHRDHSDMPIRIVVNQAESQRAGKKTYETLAKACQNFLKITPPLAGIIRRDSKVRDAIRHQTSLVIRSPNTTATTDVAALAAHLVGEPGRT